MIVFQSGTLFSHQMESAGVCELLKILITSWLQLLTFEKKIDGQPWQRKVALKSAPAISDENQISILNLSEAVTKPVTSTMSLWSEMMVNLNTPTEKWKWGIYFISSRMSGDASASLLKNKIYFCTKILPKASSASPEEAIWWKQYQLESGICSQAKAWMCHILRWK